MASRGGKQHKGSAQRKPAHGTKGTASAARATKSATTTPTTSTTTTPVATATERKAGSAVATRPAPSKATNGANGAAKTSVATVRRAVVGQPGYRSRMNQRKRMRQQQMRILGTIAAVLVVGALAWLLVSHLPGRATGKANGSAAKGTATAQVTAGATDASVATATPVVCQAVSVPGLNGNPTTNGGPPAVSGTLVNGDQCLQYVDVKPGSGAAVKAGDTVVVNYTGWLSTGQKFDSSLDAGRTPFTVQNVGQASVIQGWNMGLIGMKAGGERRLILPPALAYGPGGYPPDIPPNATLIFDISVVSIQ